VEDAASHESRHVKESAFNLALAVIQTQGRQAGLERNVVLHETKEDVPYYSAALLRPPIAGHLTSDLSSILTRALAQGLADPSCEVRTNLTT